MSGRLRAAWDALRGCGVRREDFERLHGAYLTVIAQRDQALAAKAEVTMLRGQRDENSRRAAELAAELTAAREEVAHWRQRMEAHDTQAFEAVASASEMADKVEELTGLLREALPLLRSGKLIRLTGAGVDILPSDECAALADRIQAVLGIEQQAEAAAAAAISEVVAGIASEGTTPAGPVFATHALVEVLLDAKGPTPGADGWITWDGGDVPVGHYDTYPAGVSAETVVEVEFDGWPSTDSGPAYVYAWWHDGDSDILRYRIVNAAHTGGRNSPSANSEGGAA